jgi:uncharacterized protein YegJ (DUF2314 family)
MARQVTAEKMGTATPRSLITSDRRYITVTEPMSQRVGVFHQAARMGMTIEHEWIALRNTSCSMAASRSVTPLVYPSGKNSRISRRSLV